MLTLGTDASVDALAASAAGSESAGASGVIIIIPWISHRCEVEKFVAPGGSLTT